MAPEEAWLRSLAERAAPLGERLALEGRPDPARTEAYLALWKSRAAAGDEDRFRRRLALDGLSEADLPRLLGDPRRPPEAPLPAWARFLGEALGEAGGWPRPEEPVPFQELLGPFVSRAARRLRRVPRRAREGLSEGAHRSLQEALLRRLGRLAGRTLFLEFHIHRALRLCPLSDADGAPLDPHMRGHYASFLREMKGPGLRSFFERYPVLARLLATASLHWVGATAEFLRRLHRDREELARAFHGGAELGPVTSLEADLSDPHRGGRTVHALAFGSGCSVVYKPKDLGPEAAFSGLLEWINARRPPLDLRAPKILARRDRGGGYGWAERIRPRSLGEGERAPRYYARAGMLLALYWLLDGTDGHHENLLAEGEHPVLVDLETLLHPRVLEPPTEGAGSVHRTGLLPLSKDPAAEDLSGLGSPGPSRRVQRFRDINSDTMDLEEAEWRPEPSGNLPRRGDLHVPLGSHEADLRRGFREMGAWILAHRDPLLDPRGPLGAFEGLLTRMVLRPTRTYARVLEASLRPDRLQDGLGRSLELEVLQRACLEEPGSAYRSELAAELEALEALDIPYFPARVPGPGRTAGPGFRAANPWTLLAAIDPAALRRQLEFL